MKWLQKLHDEILSSFSNPEWVNDLLSESEKNPEKFAEDLKLKERLLLIDFSQYLNYSVLEGEYVYDQDKFNKLIEELLRLLGAIQVQQIADDEDFKFTSIYENERFLFTLKKAIQFYKRISNYFHRIINNPHKNIVFDFHNVLNEDETTKYLKEPGKDLEISLLELFKECLYTSLDGFKLRNNIAYFQAIILRKDSLESIKDNLQFEGSDIYHKTIDLLKEINTFFLRKIIIRSNQIDDTYNEKYVFKGEEYHFALSEHPLATPLFNHWDNYSQLHFLSEDNNDKKIFLKRNAEELLKQNNQHISSYEEVHKLIKYYKDISTNLESLKQLKFFFKPQDENIVFNKYAFNISRNYLMNNILSLRIKKELKLLSNTNDISPTISNLESEIESLHKTSLVNNFFPYHKLCEFLKKFIVKTIASENIKSNNADLKISSAENALNKLKKLLKIYKKNLKWSKTHLFNSFQNPFSECVLNYSLSDNIDLKIFIASSFSLPIDYKKYDEKTASLDSFVVSVNNEIKSLKNILSLTNILEKKEKEIQSNINDNLKKNIEILGIFSAIIALVFGGISTINSDKILFEQQFIILVTLFIILFSFITLLRSFIYKEKNWYSVLGYFVVYLIFLIVIIILLSLVVKINS